MNLTPQLEINAPIEPSSKWLAAFCQMLQKYWQQLVRIVNGNISFGDGTHTANINGVWASLTTTGAEVTITHNLGRVPVGYIPAITPPTNSNTNYAFWLSSLTAPTSSTITFYSPFANLKVQVFIF